MKSKVQIAVRKRVFSHLKIPLSIVFRFVSTWNNPKTSKTIKGKAWDVSSKGLCLETEINMRDGVLEFSETEVVEKEKVLPYLVLSEKDIKLAFNLPPESNRIVITGKPIWHEFASGGSISKLKIGVLFMDMPGEARDIWAHYIKHAGSL
jgi:hypothetical protein